MQKAAPFFFYASRGLAVCAVLVGLGAGLLLSWAGGLICFDSCPTRDTYFAGVGPHAVQVMTPCVVLEALAMVAFLAYCFATRQPRRAIIAIVFLMVGSLLGFFALNAFLEHAQATIPIWGGEEGDLLVESSAEAWATQWGAALAFVAFAWTGVLALIQWRR